MPYRGNDRVRVSTFFVKVSLHFLEMSIVSSHVLYGAI